MDIAGRKIGPEHPPLVIAEIGINHGGDLSVAKQMVRLAAGAGCEMIKHQTHIIEDEMTEEAKQIFPPNADVSIWDVMAACALSTEDEKALKDYTESLGMIWISTPFSRAAADFLYELDVPAFKIGSGEADNLPLIRHIARMGKPVDEADLSNHQFVSADDPKSRAPFNQWLFETVGQDKVVFRATDANIIKEAVLAGAGIGFVPKSELRHYPGLVEVLESKPEWSAALWLVTHVDLHRTAKVQSFLTFLKDHSKDWPR